MKQHHIKQNAMKQFLIALTLILTLATAAHTAAHTALQNDTDVLADGSGPIMTSPYSQQMSVHPSGT